MKFNYDTVDRELRWPARIMSLLLRSSAPATFRRMDKLQRRLMVGRKPKDLLVREVWIPRRDGSQLRLVIYQSRAPAQRRPAVLWLHGGGYVLGVPEQDVATYRKMIAAGDCVIVAPDYRIAPDAPYPAALEDAYDALLWLKAHAVELGARADQIGVAGMSAGGGLTAALTLYARDRGEVKIAFQIPLYPMIDDRMSSASAIDNHAPIWDSAKNRTAWQLYLGALHGKDVPAYAAAARATDYRGLPPTCTFVGDVEPFRDETVAYVENLKAAGVPVAFELYQGAYHGFDVIASKAAISQRATAFWIDWFAQATQRCFAAQAGDDDEQRQSA